jgi:uncharacterized phage protein gp47/JayE
VAAVKAYIEDPSRRPVTADLYVVAPTPVTLNFNIQLTPNTASVKAAVEASLRDLLLREAAPGVTLLISHIREAISVAAGETDNVLISPTTNQVVCDQGRCRFLGLSHGRKRRRIPRASAGSVAAGPGVAARG